jgi:hypothetical protein
MVKSGYFSENEKKLLRFGGGGEETTPKPGKDEIVIFKSFLKAGLRFPLNRMISDVLQRFGIYFHQLTPNAIVRLSVYIWALRSHITRMIVIMRNICGWCYISYGIISSIPNLPSVSSGLMKYHSLGITSPKEESQWIQLK